MNPYEDSIVKSLREEGCALRAQISSLQSELSAAVDSYQSNVSALARKEEEVKRLMTGEHMCIAVLERDSWKQKAEALAEVMERIREIDTDDENYGGMIDERVEWAKAALAAFRESK